MTDILIHNVCFGKNTLRVTVDQTMDYNKSIPDDSVRVKSDIDNDTYNEESQDEVTEKMERINDEIENKPNKNFGNGVTEKSLDLTNIKHDVPTKCEVVKEEIDAEESQNCDRALSDVKKTNLTADEMDIGDNNAVDIDKCSKESEEVKCIENAEHFEAITVDAKNSNNSESLSFEELHGTKYKRGMTDNLSTCLQDCGKEKPDKMDISQGVFSWETKKFERNIKHERKTEKIRKSKYQPQKCAMNKSSENSEDDFCFSEDSDTEICYREFDKDLFLLKSVSGQSGTADGKDLLKFAEVLYKCTLCTSIPSILTSEESFIRHVNKQHLSKDTHCHTCKLCFLRFRTEEDLKEHIIFSHTGSDENQSCDLTGSDINMSHDHMIDSNNDSDSDSSGHRQLRTKVVKRSKPVQDFESPKQLVDHTGIETLNGSLDLTQKTIDDKKEADRHTKTKFSKEGNEINIKQITDQIIKSDVQGRNVTNGNVTKLPFSPSFTAEFGKYTKLVREGGNIVYFCQICNWKSPIKTTFQVHCNMSSHKNKVLSADNPEDNSDASSKSPKHSEKSISPNIKADNQRDRQVGKRPYSAQDISVGPRMPDQNLFYNYIMKPRAVAHCRTRTPVVSPYGTSSFIEDARFTYKRPNEHAVDLAMKKRKRFVKHPKFGQNSDSDSDDGRKDSKNCPTVKSSHSSNMTLLRQKLLEGTCGYKQNYHNALRKNYKAFHENSIFPAELSVNSNAKKEEYATEILELKAVKKEKTDYKGTDGIATNKNGKYMTLSRNCSYSPVESEAMYKFRTCDDSHDDSLFTGYKCHACSFRYSEVEEYEKHFDKVHKSTAGMKLKVQKETYGSQGQLWTQGHGDSASGSRLFAESGVGLERRGGTSGGRNNEPVSGRFAEPLVGRAGEPVTGRNGEPVMGRNGEPMASGGCEMGENWRVQKLKEILPEYVVECERGNTSRDYLLQCISSSSGIQDAVLWSSACNRAMRELFPNSQAQRKGKYKKYYFGISMMEMFPAPEELPGTEGESPLYQPHRDINIDMEKIVEHLPSILKWTGNMECGVHRQDLLILLSEALQDSDVNNWGAQCNRAIRLVFPNTDMKRKGKYKNTMYLGVEFHKDMLKRLSRYNSSYPEAQNADLGRGSPLNMPLDSVVPTDQKRGRTLEKLLMRGSNSPDNALQYTGIAAKNSSSVVSYPQWMKKEAQEEMGKYIAKFGGVTVYEAQNGSAEEVEGDDDTHDSVAPVDQGETDTTVNVTVDQGDDNDGDDEGESLDSVQTQ